MPGRLYGMQSRRQLKRRRTHNTKQNGAGIVPRAVSVFPHMIDMIDKMIDGDGKMIDGKTRKDKTTLRSGCT